MDRDSNANSFQSQKRGQWSFENNMERFTKRRKVHYWAFFTRLLEKKDSWYLLNSTIMEPTWRKLSMTSPQKSYKEKNSMTYTDKDVVEVSLNLTTSRHNIMHNLFCFDISEFAGNFQGILDEGTYKITIQNMHELGWKS